MYGLMFIIYIYSFWIFFVDFFFGLFGVGVFNFMVWVFIIDVIDVQEVMFGECEDGVIYGVNFFVCKFVQVIVGGIGGVMLMMIGYQFFF